MIPGRLQDLDSQTFDAALALPGIVIIDWWAPWCAPCRAFGPVFERVAARTLDITFAKVNTEDQPELAAEFEIRSIPTLLVIRDGIVLYNKPGMLTAVALEQVIASVRAVDMDAVKRHLVRDPAEG